MPAIPTISGTAVPSSPSGVRFDGAGVNAQAQANASMGAAVSQTANVMASIAGRRQAHINQGILAEEDTMRRKTLAEVQTYMDNNQGTPEAWSKYHDEAWKSYEDSRAQRSKNWTPELQNADKIRLNDFKSESGIRFSTQQNGALIRQANARIEANADDKMRNGDVQGALAAVSTMNLTPADKADRVAKLTNKAAFDAYDRRLSDTSNMTLVDQMKELGNIESELTLKGKKGYENGNVSDASGKVIGGMTEEARIYLIRATRAHKNDALVDMSQVGHSLVRKVVGGFDFATVFSKALKAGQITEYVARIFVPEVEMALKVKAEKEAERAAIQRDKAEVNTRLQIERPTGATVTLQEIERRQALGVTRPKDPNALTPEAADRLRAELQATEQADVGKKDFTSIEDSLNDRIGQGVFRTFFSDSAQMSDGDRSKVLERINAAKVSKGAKLKLLDKFFEVQKWDLREGEITEKDGDRQISPEEKDLRTGVIDSYRGMRSAISTRAIGARYMDDMNRIGDWYRANPSATPAIRAQKAKQFYEEISKSVSNDAATSLLQDVYE
jgi:hypothetical protein